MNEKLNDAITEINAGDSSNHYLEAILNGKIKTLADFAAYVSAEFWGCIWDQGGDPIGSMKEFISDFGAAGNGEKSLEQISVDMENCFGESQFGNQLDNFYDAMNSEINDVMLAAKYLVREQAKTSAPA